MIFWLLGGLGLFAAVIALRYWFVNANPASIANVVRMGGPILLGLLAFVILLRGAGALLPLLLPFALPFVFQQLRRGGFSRRRGGQQARQSSVETRFIEAELDHDTGAMNGRVREGRFAGKMLDALDQEECEALATEIAPQDPDGLAILAEYYERRFGEPLPFNTSYDDGSGGGGGTAHAGPMSADDAAALLGVPAHASADEIRRAYREQMKTAHPDAGGSAEEAARLNAARDLLLEQIAR